MSPVRVAGARGRSVSSEAAARQGGLPGASATGATPGM